MGIIDTKLNAISVCDGTTDLKRNGVIKINNADHCTSAQECRMYVHCTRTAEYVSKCILVSYTVYTIYIKHFQFFFFSVVGILDADGVKHPFLEKGPDLIN